jgi:NAD(P)-dependent dehydrogenase (short-subunit alcohol dehydrogenase family)
MSGVIVTGAASGIGRACAEALVAEGRRVALWDVAPSVLDVANELGMPHAIVDVTDTPSLTSAVATAATALDGLDGLVHAAGRVIPEPLGAFTDASWDAVVDVNLRAEAMLVQAMLSHLRAAAANGGNASVVGISSIEGIAGNGIVPAYCASKAGLLGLTRSMAAQLGPEGIRVNAVCPGFIITPMIWQALEIDEVRTHYEQAAPLRRMGQPAEIAAAVCFLLSEKASFITGTQIVVDGGLICQHP